MHIPVLLKEVIECLDPRPNQNFVDCTLGEAGHTIAILKKNGPRGKVLGIDQDQEMIKRLGPKERLVTVCDNFVNLKKIVKEKKFGSVTGILIDLGISSWHLEESGRGFSFSKNESLIMKIDIGKHGQSAAEIINHWPEQELERIFQEYGQERFAKKIAEFICKTRKAKPIETTFQLVEIIKRAVPGNCERGGIHPATRTFLALRIAANQELENLQIVLPQALEILEKKGKLAVISFNSLEDRIVKLFFKEKKEEKKIEILTKKPITPSFKEIINNHRARSAKLRVAVKMNKIP